MSGRIMLQDPDPPQTPEEPVPAIPPAPPPESTPPPPTPEPPPAKEANGEAAAPEGPPPDWKARIDRLTREKYEARRQAEELQRQVQTWQQQQRQAQQQPSGQGDPRAEALQQFRAEQAEREFNAACNEVFRKGQTDYADFGEAVSALNAVGYGNRPDALAAISAMPDGHHVYRALAQDLDNAARVLSMPPMHMAMELARMAQSRSQNGAAEAPVAPPLTRAPAPLRPVGGNSARPEKPLDQVSIGEFIRRRDRDTAGSSRIRR